jgi:hypothetical protein
VNTSIVEHFRTLEDPRIERTKKHNLLDILVIALCTLLTGGEGCQDMALFGKSKRAWLQTFLALLHGIPSHDTFGRVFARLHPQRFQECFVAWTPAVAQLTHGALVSLDGKTVKAAFDRATALSPLPMLSAWCADNGGLVIGQIKTEAKSNAITAIPELLHGNRSGCENVTLAIISPHGVPCRHGHTACISTRGMGTNPTRSASLYSGTRSACDEFRRYDAGVARTAEPDLAQLLTSAVE